MKRRVLLSLFGLLVVGLGSLGCDNNWGERRGRDLDRARDKVEDAVEDAGDEIEDATDRVRD